MTTDEAKYAATWCIVQAIRETEGKERIAAIESICERFNVNIGDVYFEAEEKAIFEPRFVS